MGEMRRIVRNDLRRLVKINGKVMRNLEASQNRKLDCPQFLAFQERG